MSELKITPLSDRIVVLPEEIKEKRESGLFLSHNAREKPMQGSVVAVGNGKKDEPMTVKVNDQVLYGKNTGIEISIDGVSYLIMAEKDVFAII